jgi:hypothetical protein
MSKDPGRDEWHCDIDGHQRNIVFPGTANNDAKFWSGYQRLNAVQKIGIGVLYAAVLATLVVALLGDVHSGFSWRNVVFGLLKLLIAIAFLGSFLAAFTLNNRSRSTGKPRRRE